MAHVRKLKESEVRFRIVCEPEDTPVRGNAQGSGDAAEDRAAEDEIIAQLRAGNEWAWCCVTVVATWGEWSGSDSLGGCSYESEADFNACPYYADMRKNALAELQSEVERAYAAMAEIIVDGG